MPWSLPVAEDIFTEEYFSDPHRVYAEMRASGPVHRVVTPNRQQVWLVIGYAEARAALADPRLSKDVTVAQRVYGAKDVLLYPEAEKKIAQFEADGLGNLPICMAKTQYSLSADPNLLNAPEGFTLPVRDVRAYTGAGWLVPLCGDIMQMPGLGKEPAAHNVDLVDGRIVGLF